MPAFSPNDHGRTSSFRVTIRIAILFLCLCASFSVYAEVSVRDDSGKTVVLKNPARRIISLAPNATEILFAVGAGEYVVGTVDYSDYPAAAKKIHRVGGVSLDLETIMALHPDLIVAWQSGNPAGQIERLHELGFQIFATEPRRIGDVADLMERIGRLAGTEKAATKASQEFRRHYAQLRKRYGKQPEVGAFYQILDASPLTINGEHLISDVINLCGGKNVFSDLPVLTPQVGIEAVLQKNPEAILASGMESLWPEWQTRWRTWPGLVAVKADNLFFIPPDLIHRNGPRILEGAEQVCVALEQARTKSHH